MFVFEDITQDEIDEAKGLVNGDYAEYRATSYWKKLTKIVKMEAGMRCKLCNSRIQLCSHHRSYVHMANPEKEILDLVCLCEYCHSKHHNKEAKVIKVEPNNKLYHKTVKKKFKPMKVNRRRKKKFKPKKPSSYQRTIEGEYAQEKETAFMKSKETKNH